MTNNLKSGPMKKRTALLFACFVLILAACSEEKEPAPEYSPGLIRINVSNLPANEVFDLVNGYSLIIEEIDFQLMYTPFTSDSIPFLVLELGSKAYFPFFSENQITTGFSNPSPDGLTIITLLNDMTLANQQDWLQTMDKLQLQESNMGRLLIVSVPVGTEQEWINILKADPNIEYAARKLKFEQECATPTSNFPF
jgi:hypothetical protein